jgi:hypothetical protein
MSTKPIKRPVPKSTPLVAESEVAEESVSEVQSATTAPVSSGNGIADLNVKMDKLLELAQAIDWKIWIYLKANNYIE